MFDTLKFGERARRAGADEAPVRRVGFVRGAWRCAPATEAALDVTTRRLAARGYEVVEIDAAPFVAAAARFDEWRATDDYDDLRAAVAGREAMLTPHIARLLATTATPAGPELGAQRHGRRGRSTNCRVHPGHVAAGRAGRRAGSRRDGGGR